jgi:Fe2+ transport system protein FeoA
MRCLLELKDGESGVIRANGDRKSTEMGLFPGARVVMFRNRTSERSLVIGAGDARFLVSRAIAQNVAVEG